MLKNTFCLSHKWSQQGKQTNKHKNPKQKLNKSNVCDSNPSLRELTKMAVHTKTYRPKLFPNIPVVTLI